MKIKWTKKLPNKVGWYWGYGYLNKPVDGYSSKQKYFSLKVNKCSNGFIHIANGQFIFEGEMGECIFCKVILPELPKE